MDEHLTVDRSGRGFAHLPPIPSEYGGEVRAYESSAAMGPHIWVRIECPADLNEPDGPTVEAVAHLTAENAGRLGDQLHLLVRDHYQGGVLVLWGSDCMACEGNTTPDSMTCDNCGSDAATIPLYRPAGEG